MQLASSSSSSDSSMHLTRRAYSGRHKSAGFSEARKHPPAQLGQAASAILQSVPSRQPEHLSCKRAESDESPSEKSERASPCSTASPGSARASPLGTCKRADRSAGAQDVPTGFWNYLRTSDSTVTAGASALRDRLPLRLLLLELLLLVLVARVCEGTAGHLQEGGRDVPAAGFGSAPAAFSHWLAGSPRVF